ncbi:unnamed protein product, partial [Oppiella nova]
MNSSTHVLIFLTIAGVIYGSESAPTTSTPTSLTTKVKNAVEKTEVTLKQAISIVEKRRLTECVARTLCELACNPDTYGDKGRAVYQTLKEFESESLPKLAFYKTARDRGQALTKTNCNECYTLYAKCKTPTETLLR